MDVIHKIDGMSYTKPSTLIQIYAWFELYNYIQLRAVSGDEHKPISYSFKDVLNSLEVSENKTHKFFSRKFSEKEKKQASDYIMAYNTEIMTILSYFIE